VGVYLADQTIVFLQSMLVGALLALLFDAFRISRIAIPTAGAVVFAEDVLFFAVCALVTFGLLLGTVEGQVRFFLITGEALGAVLYSYTLGRLVMAVSKTIISVIKSILRFVARWILRPIWMLVYHIVALVLRPFYFLIGIVKKSMQRCKFRLKIRRLVVYNHLVDYLHGMREHLGVGLSDEDKKKEKSE